MQSGEKLPTFDSPADAAEYYSPTLTREELEDQNSNLVHTLQKMRAEREYSFEKNSALEDACGKLMKEKVYLQQQLAQAISVFSEHQKRMEERFKPIEQHSPTTASAPTDPEHH